MHGAGLRGGTTGPRHLPTSPGGLSVPRFPRGFGVRLESGWERGPASPGAPAAPDPCCRGQAARGFLPRFLPLTARSPRCLARAPPRCPPSGGSLLVGPPAGIHPAEATPWCPVPAHVCPPRRVVTPPFPLPVVPQAFQPRFLRRGFCRSYRNTPLGRRLGGGKLGARLPCAGGIVGPVPWLRAGALGTQFSPVPVP